MEHLNNFNEKFHVNQDVKHLTSIIYNKVYQMIPALILKKKIKIVNLLQENYSRIPFKNDTIILEIGNNHAGINNPKFINGVIEDLLISIELKLNKQEINQRKLFNNNIKENINHECQHIIDFYQTHGNLTSSWDFHKRMKIHENKFSTFQDWLDVCYFFYLSEEHELRF
jgi:hypothetical protein